jgi:hypothetical protein
MVFLELINCLNKQIVYVAWISENIVCLKKTEPFQIQISYNVL